MEQFVRQQTIAIFRRLLSAQTDSNEARRERLLKLLAAEEAKSILSSQHDVSPGSAFRSRANDEAIKDAEEPFGVGSASTSPAGAER
jgi:hypothetical protein